MNMKKIYTFFCSALLMLTGCDKLVEVDYPSSQIGTEQVFADVQTANAALSGLYASLRDVSLITGADFYSASTLLASYTDDLDCYTNDQNGVRDIYLNQQVESNKIVAIIWANAYTQIYYANSLIRGVEMSVKLKEADKNRIKGEAILLRSMIYFYLQQLFGDIPYTTSIDYEFNRTLSRTGAGDVLEQLEADVTEAADLLTDDYRDVERIYPNRKAAQVLLARIYLLQSDWIQAQEMAETILSSPLYVFQADINEVFYKSGSHILWQMKPENAGDETLESYFYYFTGSAPHNYALTENLINSFATEDLRRQLWIAEVTSGSNTWYRPYKYKNQEGTNSNEYSIVFRLEEVYFIMSEALARQGRIDEALPYLNATRHRAGLTGFTSLSAEVFVTELLAEKRREYFTESGYRFIDLKRLDRQDELSALKPNWEEYKKVWPLPQNEMLLNHNLSPQNNGY
jgi:hypothetical protein